MWETFMAKKQFSSKLPPCFLLIVCSGYSIFTCLAGGGGRVGGSGGRVGGSGGRVGGSGGRVRGSGGRVGGSGGRVEGGVRRVGGSGGKVEGGVRRVGGGGRRVGGGGGRVGEGGEKKIGKKGFDGGKENPRTSWEILVRNIFGWRRKMFREKRKRSEDPLVSVHW